MVSIFMIHIKCNAQISLIKYPLKKTVNNAKLILSNFNIYLLVKKNNFFRSIAESENNNQFL